MTCHPDAADSARTSLGRGASLSPRPRSALEELTAATRTPSIAPHLVSGSTMGRGVLFAMLAALAAGAIVVFAERFQYRCMAVIQFNDLDQAGGEELMTHLAEQARAYCRGLDPGGGATTWVEAPATDLLRVNLATADRHGGESELRRRVDGLIAALDQWWQTPGRREQVLRERLAELKGRLDDAETRVINSIAATPFDDPQRRRSELLNGWRSLRDRFEAARHRLEQGTAKLDFLLQSPEPTRAPIPPQERQTAQAADEPLNQDRAELRAELVELKRSLLDVWQTAAPLADAVAVGEDRLRQTLSATTQQSAAPAPGAALERAIAAAEAYRQRFSAFLPAWTREFSRLRELEPSPDGAEVFETLDRIESIQNEFFFHAERALGEVIRQAESLGSGAVRDARLLVSASQLTRAAHELRGDHDRLNLATAARRPIAVEAALRKSRSLHRRVEDAVQRIDERLAAGALERARAERLEAIRLARAELDAARGEHDGLAGQLIGLQEELNVTSDLTADYLRSSLRVEFASIEFQDAVRDADRTERELAALEQARRAWTPATHAQVRQVTAGATPINLGDRLWLGGAAALVTLFVSLLSQWHLARRRM